MVTEPVTQLWKAHLRRGKADDNGEKKLVACFENVALVLHNDASFNGCFARNELSGETELVKKLPNVAGNLPPRRGAVDEYIVGHTRMALSALHELSVGIDVTIQGIEYAARQRCYNPLHDYLRSLKWDGVKRLGTWLHVHLGAEQTSVTESVGRWWLISAMARAFRPGCQVDHVLVLEGPQGAGKSTALGILGGEWYVSKIPPVRDYAKAAHAMAGAWLVEIGEMDAFRGAASSQIKDFLSLSEDRYQPPYGRFVIKQPRRCVFAGTTNDAHYLRDATGARRFWPVKVGKIDRETLTRDRDQLLAEARVAFEDGAPWWPDDAATGDLAEEQEARHEADEWEVKIAAWLNEPKAVGVAQGGGEYGEPKDGVSTGDILLGAHGLSSRDWTQDAQTRVGTAMRRLGWVVRRPRNDDGTRVRRYYRSTR